MPELEPKIASMLKKGLFGVAALEPECVDSDIIFCFSCLQCGKMTRWKRGKAVWESNADRLGNLH